MPLQPLIPDPNDPKGKLPPQLGNLRGQDASGGMPSLGPLPQLPQAQPQPMPGLRPLVTNPRQQQEQTLQQKISSFENPAAPKGGFWHTLGRVAARAGNIAGDVVAPGTMALIPGTDLYRQEQHGRNVRELAGLQSQDVQEQEAAAKRTLEGAQTEEAQARARAIENPPDKPDKFTFQQTDHGLMRIDSVTGEATPVTYQGQPLQPHEKEAAQKGAEHVTVTGPNGKPMLANFHPDTGKYTDAAGNEITNPQPYEKQPQAPGVTVMVPNAQGGYTVQRAGAGQTLPGNAVTPAGMSSLNVPTSSTRTMVETAPRVIELADRAEQMIDPQVQALGPAASRWAEFMAGKVGAPNKEFTILRTNIGLLTTALMRMHVGARGGEQIMQHFQDLVDSSKQSPENLRAALEEIKTYAHQVAGEGRPGGLSQSAGGGPSAGTVENGYRFKGGDPAKQENWEKVK